MLNSTLESLPGVVKALILALKIEFKVIAYLKASIASSFHRYLGSHWNSLINRKENTSSNSLKRLLDRDAFLISYQENSNPFGLDTWNAS